MTIEIPPPLPDELVFGAISRARVRLGISSVTISRHIFEARIFVRPHFCGRLDKVASQLRDRAGWKLDANDLRDKHSLAPISLPFVPALSRQNCKRALHSDERMISMLKIPRRVLDITPFLKLRSCLQCQANDLDVFGEAYWHRIHQIPALKICPYHLRPLVEHSVTAEPLSYIALEESQHIAEFAIAEEAFPLQEAIGRSFADLLNQPITGFDRQRFAETYRISLANRNLRVGVSWRMAQELERHFGPISLATVNSLLPKTLSCLTHRFYSHKEQTLLPSHFFAVVATQLNMQLRDLIDVSLNSPSPEQKPWPCMNPTCSCHGTNVITSKYWSTRHHKWSFRCPKCFTCYYRSDPLARNTDGSFDFNRVSTANCIQMAARQEERRNKWLKIRNNPSLRSTPDTIKLKRFLAIYDSDWFQRNMPNQPPIISHGIPFKSTRAAIDNDWFTFSKKYLPREVVELKKHFTSRISYNKLGTILANYRLKRLPVPRLIPLTAAYIRSFTETTSEKRVRVNKLKEIWKQTQANAPHQLVLKFSYKNQA